MIPVLTVKFFCTDSGREPVRDWLKNDLSPEDRRIIGIDIKTAQFGWPIGMPVVRKIATNLWEVRSRIRDGIARTFFTVVDSEMILLHGFVKKSQKTPKEELLVARTRLRKFSK
ncbi:MAG: type II toxin-antitoxin system RelE/ParE family toxin [Acidobacteria bacterium]|nr:type II toxin-antitoxin system RelE/ParE family toxin [Acidobacteriota bacterium]